ncbi:MAG: IS200/IS605 family accessory protein TnpB-related protein [Hydrogenobacter thermophilus]|uniref:IS200/IS605 family accessory protein TnpB-related protein n=1 Tax=Hydrogenobacter thermophilus TaxID=940 RepID=UPI001C767F72|nr:IS200/IS605 family accessory protein TnpB-related protein [Hydrogenobacter thermophilus]QWK19038.1 MAG: IS200/IS605 family accessory protein TnpB-related protein [Hydrogenobacter thermophilus]
MITLHCKIAFENKKDKEKLLKLMRRFCSCYRYAYSRLLEKQERKDLKKELQKIFCLNSRYCDDAIFKAQSLINLCKETGQNPEKVIFGGRKLFEKLKKKHLNGQQSEKLRQKWEERRKGLLYSRGDKTKKGNLNTRIEFEKDNLKLRINTGERGWIKANIKRTVNRQNDKWINFIADLLQAEKTGEYFLYSVEIRKINNNFYAFISYEEVKLEEPIITKDSGVIGIDINASPFHIAMVSVKPDGNLEKIRRISLHTLLGKTKNQREYLSWQIAHQITDIAKEENKAIAIERLSSMPKGERGDGNGKLRKRLQQWIYKGLLEKIKALAKRKRIQVIEVNPAYTSVVGALKYAPQYSLDKDTAGAFVIGRKVLGFRERLPENYEKLITDKEYLDFVVERLQEEKQKTQEKLKEENNQYKRKPLKSKINELNKQLKIIQSLYSEPQTQEPVNRWKEQVRGLSWASYKLWQIVKVALAFPVLGKSLSRDLSPLKAIIVSGDWDRVARRLAPVSWDRGYVLDKYRQLGICPELNEAGYKYPSTECSFMHFG